MKARGVPTREAVALVRDESVGRQAGKGASLVDSPTGL
ncbi:hypothetical protein D187_002158 [Cystobacter fuscus DSM 2262]|uniref:Uncharacterized protein n=1 Tax=Cystobacter fuscus (strain ATCC 25194 / DSM 2262 / NBRC 100088 / M29) TaxID=1242864 RepID=S9PCR2_CYSF2|nr:hypothetical protein D187_002158 [Cystobacter fuscus DSM 2262]